VDDRGFELHDIGAEADQHLRRGLAGDAAIDEVRVVKERLFSPELRDRVTHEYDALRVSLQRCIGFSKMGEIGPVLRLRA
jgi:hypothetical protein